MFDNVTSSFPLVASGKLRALGVTTKERSVTMPDVPPISDSLPGYEGSSFYGLGAPARTPMPIVDLLNRNVNEIVAQTSIRKQFDDLGAIPLPGSALQFAAMLQTETEHWRKVVEAAHLRKQ
jgi:tripartite-type tricarboxylate transporter receptor subunit TctC